MFKMRELRGAGVVQVHHIPTEQNPADLFTKVLGRQLFEKHRATVLGMGSKGWNGSAKFESSLDKTAIGCEYKENNDEAGDVKGASAKTV